MNWTLTTKEELLNLFNSVGHNIKEGKMISGSKKDYASYAVVTDNKKGKGEVHEKMRDVWIFNIVGGYAKFIIGGRMVNPISPRETEWLAEEIEGGSEISISTGDMLEIPAGVPHQLDATGGRVEAIVIKVPKLPD